MSFRYDHIWIMSDIILESTSYLVVGQVDSGKSTLIGVLTCQGKSDKFNETSEIDSAYLDNGNGSARSNITTLGHEIESGRTSTHMGYYMITLDQKTKKKKVTTIIDLCGHEKYLKTTLFGITGLSGDIGIVVIGANMGISNTTKEHMKILIYLKVPFIIVVTKIDLLQSNNMWNSLKKNISRTLSKCGNREPLFVDEDNPIDNGMYNIQLCDKISNDFQDNLKKVVPVISVSNKTGHNIGFIRQLLTYIDNDAFVNRIADTHGSIDSVENKNSVMFLDCRFSVKGVGIVISGSMGYGDLNISDPIFIGPIDGSYVPAKIRSLKNRVGQDVPAIYHGESGSMSFRVLGKNHYSLDTFKKGHVVCTNMEFAKNNTCYTITVDYVPVKNGFSVRPGYQCVLHCMTVRHTVVFQKVEGDVKFGRIVKVTMKFIGSPEFVVLGSKLVFRDGDVKGIGRVTEIIPFQYDTRLSPKKNKKLTLKALK